MALASAGIMRFIPTMTRKSEMNTKLFKRMFDINFWGSVFVAKYASIVMSKNKPVNDKGEKGLIIFVSSVAAEDGQKGWLGYSSSKAALNGLVLPMARDLGKYGIRSVAIAPAFFHTPMTAATNTKELLRLVYRDVPLGRGGQPEEFAHFTEAIIENSYINGVRLRIDGGAVLSNL